MVSQIIQEVKKNMKKLVLDEKKPHEAAGTSVRFAHASSIV